MFYFKADFTVLFFTIEQVRVVNFNVYMGYDRRGENSSFRVVELLKRLEADVAALQVSMRYWFSFLFREKSNQFNSAHATTDGKIWGSYA